MTSRPAMLLLWLLCALLARHAVAADSDLHTLDINASVPAVTVSPQPASRHSFNLPTLQYDLHVEARCHAGWTPESLSVNVADSRVSRMRAELHDKAEQHLQLRVPAHQIAPVVMRKFCVIDGGGEGSASSRPAAPSRQAGLPSQLTVHDVLSANASLRCSNDEEHRTIYVSRPLHVAINCRDGVSGRNPEPRQGGERQADLQ